MNKHSNKKLIMTEEDDIDFEKSSRCWTCDNVYIEGDSKVRDFCHITETDRGFAHTDCNISIKLNHKMSIVFHNLKNYDSHLVMQKLCRFNFK